jgi:hypothetical protein
VLVISVGEGGVTLVIKLKLAPKDWGAKGYVACVCEWEVIKDVRQSLSKSEVTLAENPTDSCCRWVTCDPSLRDLCCTV